jgi:hypothetical protein
MSITEHNHTSDPCGGAIEYLHRSPASRKSRRKGNPVPGVQLDHLVPGGYKYGDLALQVAEVSEETVKYGLSSAGLRPKSGSGKALKKLYSKLQMHPLVREGAPQQETRSCQQ